MQKIQAATPVTTGVSQTEILTIDELAAWLKCSRNSIYGFTRKRSQFKHDIPVPVLRLPCGIRFRRSDIEEWVQRHAEAGRGKR